MLRRRLRASARRDRTRTAGATAQSRSPSSARTCCQGWRLEVRRLRSSVRKRRRSIGRWQLYGLRYSATVQPINIDSIAPVVTPSPNQVAQQTSGAGATVTYPKPSIAETGSGVASSSCLPASGSVFSLGLTTVTCTAIDLADNSGSATFTVTVTPVTPTADDGRMLGVGFVDQAGKHQHFAFRVAQIRSNDFGRLSIGPTSRAAAGEMTTSIATPASMATMTATSAAIMMRRQIILRPPQLAA